MQNVTHRMTKTGAKISTNKSKRMTKTLVELSIGVIGLLAIMISQLGAQSNEPVLLERLSSAAPVKLVFMLCEELPAAAVATTRRLNR